MSGIFGVVGINNKKINSEKAFSMMNDIKKYKVDDISYIQKENCFLACAKQYITEESINEILPFEDTKNKILIVADAIIDNKYELFVQLDIKNSKNISDSYLILEAYKKWGKKCIDYLIGDFAFVIIDDKKIFIARDHCGHRSLYYSIFEDQIVFSTTLQPISKFFFKNLKFNEFGVASYLIDLFEVEEDKRKDTIFEKIFLLEPATTLELLNENLVKECYWNPLELDELKFRNDEECFDEFIKIFDRVIKDKLRTNKNVGIMLSGGLDSTSVAAIAAKHLEEEKKELKAFTTVPFSNYEKKESKICITDERQYVKYMEDMYRNIEVEYCCGENSDAIEVIDKAIEYIEEPYVAIENVAKIIEGMQKAKSKECAVVLTGQFGNLSISYGDILTNMKTLFEEKKYFEILKEINCISKIGGRSKRAIYKIIKNNKNKKFKIKAYDENNEILLEKFITKYKLDTVQNVINSFDEVKKMRIRNLRRGKVSVIDTVVGLNVGLVIRDPTKDKRIVEFCTRLPHNFFVKNGINRYLIRKSMENIVPDAILNNFSKKGVQGVDWIQQIEKNNNFNKLRIKEMLNDEFISNLINIEKLENKIDDINLKETSSNDLVLKKIMRLYIFYKFKKSYDYIN